VRTRIVTSTFLIGAIVPSLLAQSPAPAPPPWAYAVNPPPTPGAPPPAPDPNPKQVPGSSASFTVAQTRDAFNPPDWYPGSHPPMPESVAHGRRPEMRACGFCHLMSGQGRPENAAVAGLPAAYIVQQMSDFKNGLRKSAEPRMGPPNAMIQDAKAANDEEIRTAATYFASVPFKKWIRVVESRDAPKTRIAGSMHVPTGDGMEPLGQRIIEVPEDLARTELRDGASGFVAYVPVGSIKKGQAMVNGSGGKTAIGGPVAQLHRPSAVRLSTRRPSRGVVAADESCSRQADDRRSHRDRRIHVIVRTVICYRRSAFGFRQEHPRNR
jgi:cytochrome c553